MYKPFFPDPVFGWSFFGVLMILLAAAAYIDVKTARIPKAITLTLVAGGIVASIIRCAWLSGTGRVGWAFDAGSYALGGLDGLLFSLLGVVFAFFLFFGMWMLGSCGGGDVKLCAGIGGWIGAYYTLFLLLASVVALVFWIAAKVLTGGMPTIKQMRKAQASLKNDKKPKGLSRGRMTFSVPAAISAAAVILWFMRYDLQLDTRPPAPANEANHASVEPANP